MVESAFTTQTRGLDELINLDATDYHLIPYVTGGLGRLIHLIREDKVPDLPEFGYHTDSDGHFAPQGACLMALRYEVKQILDTKGQSAVLVLAEDLFQKNQLVVIKVLHTQFYKLGVQETHVLWRLAMSDPLNHSHTLRILTTFTFDGHYCMVFEPLLPDPLTTIFQEFPKHKVLLDIKKVGLRLLATIGFLHQQNLIHTDLKPDNILLKYENDLDSVHIVDFGNTINYVHSELSLYYKDFELQTPLYRAPEVIFGVPFGPEIDIWSLGCIFAELYLGKPLLLGDAMEDILKHMCELLGPCPAKFFRRGKFFRNLRQYTSNENQVNASTKIFEHLQLEDYLFADLLAGMLRYNPDERLTASKAAQHPFFASHFPVAFLMQDDTGRSALSSVPLSQNTYKFSPIIARDIRKGQPSSVDLLRLGTKGRHPISDLEETVILKPSPRYKLKGENLSIFEEQTHLFPTSTEKGNTSLANKNFDSVQRDAHVVKNVITERKERVVADKMNEKMSTLLKAIRSEQDLVENDLEKKFDDYRKIAGSFQTVRPTEASVSVKPVPRYGAYKLDMLKKSNRVERTTENRQKVFRKHPPSHETIKVEEERQGAVTAKHETFLVKTERNSSSKAGHGKSTFEIVGQCKSGEESHLSRQGLETVGRTDELDDRTLNLQRYPSDESDRPNTNIHNAGVGMKKTNSSGNKCQIEIIDSPNKAAVVDADVSPGFTSSRTKYTPKLLQTDVQDKFGLKSISSVSPRILSSSQMQTKLTEEEEGELETSSKASAETLDSKSGRFSSWSRSKSTQPESIKTPGRRLTEISSEGRKRVYADCLSDDEVIDVLSPVSLASVSKRQKQLNTGQGQRKHSLYNECREDVHAKSNYCSTDNYDSIYAVTGESKEGSKKSFAANKNMYTLSRNVDNIEHAGIDQAKRCPRGFQKAKMSYIRTNGRNKNNEKISSNRGQTVTERDKVGMSFSETEANAHYEQATVMACSQNLYHNQTNTDNAHTKYIPNQFKLKSGEMLTPISKVPQTPGVMANITEDSPEIIYKSFKFRSKETKPRTRLPLSNDNKHVYHKHVETGHTRDLQFGEVKAKAQELPPDRRRQKASTENKDLKKTNIVRNTTKHLKSNLNYEGNHLQMELKKRDKFTFFGTPASDLKIQGKLAERIVERNKKFRKKARKSLNFQQSVGDLYDESSNDSENSEEEFVDESIFETLNKAHKPTFSQQLMNTVKKTSDKCKDFHSQNAPKGKTYVELQRKFSEMNNPKDKGMMKVNRHSKRDTTFVLDFESPSRHGEWKK